jgi:hypothetical protein
MGFDLNITYTSDTVHGKFAYEEMGGNYILNDQSIYYKMGSTEYVQNDSFVYSIYNEDKTMMMTRDVVTSKSSLFPMKQFVDSTLSWFDTSYIISSYYTVDSVKVLSFQAKTTDLPYQWLAIYYDNVSYQPEKVEMWVYSGVDESDTVFLVSDTVIAKESINKPVKRRITMNFSNYYTPKTLEVFNNFNYVFYNRVSKRYTPSGKYRGYMLYVNGAGSDTDPSVEMYPPPEETTPPL